MHFVMEPKRSLGQLIALQIRGYSMLAAMQAVNMATARGNRYSPARLTRHARSPRRTAAAPVPASSRLLRIDRARARLLAAYRGHEAAKRAAMEVSRADAYAAYLVSVAGLQAARAAFRTSPPALATLVTYLSAVAATLAAQQADNDDAALVHRMYLDAAWAAYQAEVEALLVPARLRKKKTA